MEVEKLKDYLCPKCYIERNLSNLVEIPRNHEVKVCKSCLRVKDGFKWVEANGGIIRFSIGKIVEESRKSNEISLDLQKYEIESKERERYLVRVQLELRFMKERREISGVVNIKEINNTCPSCLSKRGNIYEAIIQVRGEKVREIIEKIVNSHMNFITKIENVDRGVDLYISETGVALKIVKGLHREGVIKKYIKSYKNEKVKDGKRYAKLVISIS